MRKKTTRLRACPFCGGKKTYGDVGEDGDRFRVCVFCYASTYGRTQKEADEKWESRKRPKLAASARCHRLNGMRKTRRKS